MSIPTHCTKWPSSGRLGLGNQECMASPQPVAVSEDIRPCSVYCGVDCSVILTLDGTLLCCGNNRWDTLTASLIDLLLCYTDDRWHTDWLTYGLTAPLYWWWVAHWLSHVLTYCSVILMLDDTRMLWLWCGLLRYTDAGWHTVCCDWCGLLRYTDAGWHIVYCDCGVDSSVILMLGGTLCAVTGVDCSVILMLGGTLCAVTGVDCSVILMLGGTLCAVTGVDCSVILMLGGTLCAVTGVDCSVILMLDSMLLCCRDNRDMLA